MILQRLGSKQAIAAKIIPHFPIHKIFIDVFFGAGGMFFNKPKVKTNIVNDLDSDVFNLFMVVLNHKEQLQEAFYSMPIHKDLFEYWKVNIPNDNIQKALRFLLLSNYSFMNTKSTMIYEANSKHSFFDKLNNTHKMLFDVNFSNENYDVFLKDATSPRVGEKDNIFIYADPPYLYSDTKQNAVYNMKTWTEQDLVLLFDSLNQTGCKFAMSEFDNPFILNQAKERNLNVKIIGERNNLKNTRTEILITNYKNQPSLFD